MASAQDLRRRIKTVKNIEQITKAMKMVAAARLRRAQEKANLSRPYTEKIRHLLASVALHTGEAEEPLLDVREVSRTGYVVLSADKGLAGALSSNLIKEVLRQMEGKADYGLITVGRKARDYFTKRGYTIDAEYTGFSEKPSYAHAQTIAGRVAEGFITRKYDEVYVVYNRFQSAISQVPTTVRLLPAVDAADRSALNGKYEYIYEPSANEVLRQLLPKYLETVIYGALLQSAASEQGARMTAMGAATDNAEELIAKLILNYNKVRQATITREISEIVGGADALE